MFKLHFNHLLIHIHAITNDNSLRLNHNWQKLAIKILFIFESIFSFILAAYGVKTNHTENKQMWKK